MLFQNLIEKLNSDYLFLIFGGIGSLLTSILIISTKKWHINYTADQIIGIQKVHNNFTPRIGGLSIFIGVFIAYCFVPEEHKDILGKLLFASLPAFLFGLLEDITKKVGVWERLLATIFSVIIAIYLTNYYLSNVNIIGIDFLLKFFFISVFVTSLSVSGVANSFNIIDGLNGLTSLTAIFISITIALIALKVGDILIFTIVLVYCSVLLGFFIVNWPFGKIFLGDGGSYFIGFSLAYLSIMLIVRNPNIEALAILLIFLHPVFEVIFSIYRRLKKGKSISQPDKLHLHSLVYFNFTQKYFPNFKKNFNNSASGLTVSLSVLVTNIIAILIFENKLLLIITIIIWIKMYILIYYKILLNYKLINNPN